jgi:hypothetical protein
MQFCAHLKRRLLSRTERPGTSLLSPSVRPSPFPFHALTDDAAAGTILYNVVDTTAGVVPVTFVDPVIDAVTPEWLAKGQQGSPMVEDRVYGKNGVYDAVSMKGLPVGIQIVGAAWEEEKVIEIMRVVDTLLGPRGFGPGEYTKRKMEEK